MSMDFPSAFVTPDTSTVALLLIWLVVERLRDNRSERVDRLEDDVNNLRERLNRLKD